MRRKILMLMLCCMLAEAGAQSIVAGEYFIDTAPPNGGGTSFSINPGNEVSQTINIPITSLDDGFHHVFIRVKDDNNTWSHYEGRIFYIIPPAPESGQHNLISGEWFIDEDPGIGGGNSFGFTSSANVNSSLDIDINGLDAGFHHLFIRVKNAAGIWSHYEGRIFYIIPQETIVNNPLLVAGEWFIDEDPGLGNGTAISFDAGNMLNELIDIGQAALSPGVHNLFIRVKDANDVWSHYEGREFTVCLSEMDLTVVQEGATLTASMADATYQWLDCDNDFAIIEGATAQSYTSTINGNFAVVITTETCTATSACMEILELAIINGTVNWNTNCGTRDATVKLYEVGTTILISEMNTTVNSDGTFTADAMPTGTYDVYVKVAGYLQKGFGNLTLNPGSNSLDVGAILGGDFDNSNGVSVFDISVIAGAYGSVTGDANFNQLADFDCNGSINIADVSSFVTNFGQTGDKPPSQ